MKIGIEVQRLFREQKFGIETSALQLIKTLQQLNTGAEFVIFAKSDTDQHCLAESKNLKIKKVAGKLFVDFEHVFLPLAAKQEQVDLLHCTGNTTPYFSSVPIVQTLHDVIFMDPISRYDTWYRKLGNFYRRKLVPVVTQRSQKVITVSNFEKERIVNRLGIDESKISVIYNGIDEKRFCVQEDPALRARIRKRYNLPERFILFLGNTSPRKNSLRVIEAYTQYASKHSNPLPLVTPGLPAHFIHEHLAALGQPDKKKNFITPGYIADEDLAILYNLSTLFLFPSVSEGFGMPIIEAMACGAPVITSSISCLPEIAGDAALLVNPMDAGSIAAGIETLLNNDNLRQEKISQGFTNVNRFSWTKTAEQVFKIYENVLYCTQKANKSARVAYEV